MATKARQRQTRGGGRGFTLGGLFETSDERRMRKMDEAQDLGDNAGDLIGNAGDLINATTHASHEFGGVAALAQVASMLNALDWWWLPRLPRATRAWLLVLGGVLIVLGWVMPWYAVVYQPSAVKGAGAVVDGRTVVLNGHKFDVFLHLGDRFYLHGYSGALLRLHPSVNASVGAMYLFLFVGFGLIAVGALVRIFDPESVFTFPRVVGAAVRGLPVLIVVWPAYELARHLGGILSDPAVLAGLRQSFLRPTGATGPSAQAVSVHAFFGLAVLGLGFLIAAFAAGCGQKKVGVSSKPAEEGEFPLPAAFTTSARIALGVAVVYAVVYVLLHLDRV